jgi:hypothetical protein
MNPIVQPPHEAGKGVGFSGDQVQLSGTPDTKYQELQQKNERSNTAAGAIRDTDRSLETFGQKIDTLKAPLETIVKNFPPFSPQDKARVKLLMNYSSLRKEIDQLTLPPPPDVVKARKALALPTPLPVAATEVKLLTIWQNLTPALPSRTAPGPDSPRIPRHCCTTGASRASFPGKMAQKRAFPRFP